MYGLSARDVDRFLSGGAAVAGARRSLQAVPDDSFASLLRARREVDGLTQAQLGERFSVRQQTIGAWEKGERPQVRFAGVLAEYLGLSEDDLRALIDRPAPNTSEQVPATMDPIDRLTESFAERLKREPMTPGELDMFRELFDYHRGVEGR